MSWEIGSLIQAAAAKRGIDPDIALTIAMDWGSVNGEGRMAGETTRHEADTPKKHEAEAPTRYRALVGLSYPTDPELEARLRDGEDIPEEERKMKRVEAGRIAVGLPEKSVPWLLKQGLIEPVEEVPSGEVRE